MSAPRKRPRVRSVSFQQFHWLLLREAVAEILWPNQLLLRPGHCCYWLTRTSSYTLRRVAERCLAKFPSRRIVP